MNAGDNIETETSQWSFRGDVVEAFDEHVTKSVPLYDQGHGLVLHLSDFFVCENSICYDIGSSTGTLLHKLAKHHLGKKNVRFIGIDKEGDMLKKANNKNKLDCLEFVNEDICNYTLKRSRFVVAYYVFQFIEKKYRQNVIQKIYDSLESGGAFVMFEKVNAVNSTFQDLLNNAYFDFKVDKGFSYEEVLGKSFSIRGVLVSNTTERNVEMLQNAGFSEISSIMKYCNFEGYIAVKP